eukprot:TRINITY_DN4074_c0_g1_i1.p1 TRINITY_DN4074_c0_g1~~TRINITY_DN4074_c0_g1_i1.p1  ORF type:complete len:1258 (+),score=313.99 TRINITY_DN4074_c0_g1_i1:89-3775(+)
MLPRGFTAAPPMQAHYVVGQRIRARGRLTGDRGQIIERGAPGRVTAVPGPGVRLLSGAVAEVEIQGVTFDALPQMIEPGDGPPPLKRAGGSPGRGRRDGGQRRRDPTMLPDEPGAAQAYSLAEFLEFYGEEKGHALWREAGRMERGAPRPASASRSPRRASPPRASPPRASPPRSSPRSPAADVPERRSRGNRGGRARRKKAAAASPRGGGGDEERRPDPTCEAGTRAARKTYTRAQFQEFYGQSWKKVWKIAGRQTQGEEGGGRRRRGKRGGGRGAGGGEDGSGEEECRPDVTCQPGTRAARKTYTRAQFDELYGPEIGKKMWKKGKSAAGGGEAEVERRRDPTVAPGEKGHTRAFSHEAFLHFYGAKDGERLWRLAGQQSGGEPKKRRSRRGGKRERERRERSGAAAAGVSEDEQLTLKITRATEGAIGWGRKGLAIVDVEARTPAARAGVRRGMRIVKIDGKAVSSGAEVAAAIEAAGTEFEVVVVDKVETHGTFGYPVAERGDTVDEMHGRKVPDPYRWLEDPESEDTKRWIRRQRAVTERVLSAIPWRDRLREEMTKQLNYPKRSAPRFEGGRWYYSMNTGLQNQSVLMTQKDIHDKEEEPQVFCDPNKFSEDGTTTLANHDWTDSGKLWVYAISKKGSDWSTVHVKDIASGKDLKDELEWVKYSSLCWSKDEKGFFYSRYPKPEGLQDGHDLGTETGLLRGHALYYHVLGTPQSEDRLIASAPENPELLFFGSTTEDRNYLIITVSKSTDSDVLLWYIDLTKKAASQVGPADIIKIVDTWGLGEFSVVDNVGESLLIQTTNKAPRKRLIRIYLSKLAEADWEECIPEHPKNPLQWVGTAKNGILYSCYMENVIDVLYRSTVQQPAELTRIPLEVIGTVGSFNCYATTTEVFFSCTSYTFPNRIYHFDSDKGFEPQKWYESAVPGHDSSKLETKQVFVKSKDGVKVPMFLVHRKGLKLDGRNVTHLSAYGGFRSAQRPHFSALRLSLLNGFDAVHAEVCARGGDEYGEEWWEAGKLSKKQNTLNDVVAAAKWLSKHGYSDPERVAVEGGSNGGLVVVAAANQAPHCFGAVVCDVGLLDMLRYHKFGIAHLWCGEYGHPDNKEEFEFLYRISPYHNVSERKTYPAIMCTCGDHDDRVVPLHTYKFVAELQYKCGKQAMPLIARVETRTGHGGGKPLDRVIQESADVFSFITYYCGVRPRRARRRGKEAKESSPRSEKPAGEKQG